MLFSNFSKSGTYPPVNQKRQMPKSVVWDPISTWMFWACHSYNTIKIASVNGRYMVKVAIIGSEMAHNWA